METVEEKSKGKPETSPPTAARVAAPKKAKRTPGRFWRSIRVRTIAINIAYAVTILIMLWACFFIFIFGFYGEQLRDELGDFGKKITETFPYRIDDMAFERYKQEMSSAAIDEMVALSVFTLDADGKYNVVVHIDTLGNGIEHGTDTFDGLMQQINVEDFGSDEVLTVGTGIGTFLCYCAANEIVTDAGADTAYLLVVKPYQLMSTTVESIIFALIGCSVVVLGLAIVASYLLSYTQTRRIKDISNKAKMLAEGDYSVEFTSGGCDEYDSLANTLNLAAEEMNKTETFRRDMIANVSHDIRTPLTMIRGYAEMVRDMPLDEEKREKIANVIIDETDRLNALTADLLSLSKLQSGVAEFNYERVNISKLAHATIAKFDIFADRDGVVFESDIADDVYAVCDAQRIKQVLYNFIGNAINYCGDDKVVTVSVKPVCGGGRVEIGDHGKGIAPEDIDSVWTRYYRTAQSKRTTVGTGLGLSICKNVLDSHGAAYSVTSELGKGTVFSFELKDAPKNPDAQ